MQKEKERTSTTLLRFTLRIHFAFALISVIVTATLAFFIANYLDLRPLFEGLLKAAIYALICIGTLRAFRAGSPWLRAGLLFLGGFNAMNSVRICFDAQQVFLTGTTLSQGSVAAIVWFTSLSAAIFLYALFVNAGTGAKVPAGASE